MLYNIMNDIKDDIDLVKIYNQIYKNDDIFNDDIYNLIDNSHYFSLFVRKNYNNYDVHSQDSLILSLILCSYIIALS